MASVVAAMVSVEEGDLPDVALAVLNELLFGGNMKVQNTLYQWMMEEDTEGDFLKHLQDRLNTSMEMIDEGKKYSMLGEEDKKDISEEVHQGLLNATQTVVFCRLLCVNHCDKFQNILREQPGHTTQFNLINHIIELLARDADSSIACANLREEEYEMCCSIMRFLVSAMHGPCPGNQQIVARSDIVNTTIMMIPADSCATEREEIARLEGRHRSLSTLACEVLEACLEGGAVDRNDMYRHLEMKTLYKHARELDDEVQRMYKVAKSKSRMLTTREVARRDVVCDTLTKIYTMKELLDPKSPMSVLKSHEQHHAGGEVSLVGTVEVFMNNEVHECFFPMPVQAGFLSEETKAVFLRDKALKSVEQRVVHLIEVSSTKE